jgi:hypothetical protein
MWREAESPSSRPFEAELEEGEGMMMTMMKWRKAKG